MDRAHYSYEPSIYLLIFSPTLILLFMETSLSLSVLTKPYTEFILSQILALSTLQVILYFRESFMSCSLKYYTLNVHRDRVSVKPLKFIPNASN